MLFQEKAAKELLEFNKRREGPILEGDQKFFFKLVKERKNCSYHFFFHKMTGSENLKKLVKCFKIRSFFF